MPTSCFRLSGGEVNTEERKKFINASDFTILCLPDIAAIEAVSLVENDHTRIIDASTAHRVDPEWAYGFPELSPEHREKIRTSKRVAVPGCYASGFISMAYPLVKSEILPKDYPVSIHAVSGYSGAGKKGIAQYEADERAKEFDTPRQYALTQQHKHLPEMKIIPGLEYEPTFNPYVCDYYAGMTVSLPLHTRLLSRQVTPAEIRDILAEHYRNSNFVKVAELDGKDVLPDGFIGANTLEGTNNMELIVSGNAYAGHDNAEQGHSYADKAGNCKELLVVGAAIHGEQLHVQNYGKSHRYHVVESCLGEKLQHTVFHGGFGDEGAFVCHGLKISLFRIQIRDTDRNRNIL